MCIPYVVEQIGTVTASSVLETSGLVASRRHPGGLWVHNDSGDSARLYGLKENGVLHTQVDLSGTEAIDFEDIAFGRDPFGVPVIVLADIGDNAKQREDVILHQFEEPDWGTPNSTQQVTSISSFTLRYPDGAHDAETLLFDPWTESFFIVTKSLSGESHLYGITAAALGQQNVLEKIGTLQFGSPPLAGGTTVTAGDIGPNGHYIALRTYTHIFVWKRDHNTSLWTALQREPCVVYPEAEPQGEALGFAAEGVNLFSISEGRDQPVYHYKTTATPTD